MASRRSPGTGPKASHAASSPTRNVGPLDGPVGAPLDIEFPGPVNSEGLFVHAGNPASGQRNAEVRKLRQSALPPGGINRRDRLHEGRCRPRRGRARHCTEDASTVSPLFPPDSVKRCGLTGSIHGPTVGRVETRNVVHHQLWNTALSSLRYFVWTAHDHAARMQALMPRLGRYALVLHGEAPFPCSATMSCPSDDD